LTDAAFPDRLTQLRAKWEADPTSRVFLQLAEEYRHIGRVKDGLAVLDRGLKEHPGYLSALVAKGRCHLELGEGEAARAVLERVVKQDATQMVANKLLVRAYLETGDPGKARERLDLYTLLNDSDPEIEELRRRIRSMDRPAPAEETRQMDADPFSLEPVTRRPVAAADVFDFEPAPPPSAAREEPEPDAPPDDLFPGLSSRDSLRRYLEGLGAEGLFSFAPPEPIPSSAPAEPLADESAWLEETAVTSSYAPPPAEPPEPPLFAGLAAPPAPAEEDLWDEEPAPPAAADTETVEITAVEESAEIAEVEEIAEVAETAGQAAPVEEPIATATLGEIYLRQGYLAEAERIFHEVLQHEPENAAAQAGLARLAAATRHRSAAPPLAAHQLLAGFQPSAGPAGGVTARKIFLLNSYLERLRQGRKGRDVS
jgi:tetratricopeptide (TPR) repeat protein